MSAAKPHFALVVLVIASAGESYAQFRECWRAYMHSFPRAKVFFVMAKADLPVNVLAEADSITVRAPDNKVPGILYKSHNAMHWCHANLSYDAVLRTNLSTFVHLSNVLDFVEAGGASAGAQLCSLPALGGGAAQHAALDGLLGAGEGAKFLYLHGAFTLLSRETAAGLFRAVADMDAGVLAAAAALPDDVALSALLRLSGAPAFENLGARGHQSTRAEQGARAEYAADVLWVRNKTTTNACLASEERCAVFRAHDVRCYVNQVRGFHGGLGGHPAAPPGPARGGPRVADCFMFGVELDMLMYRLSVLDAEVDFFVLCESARSHMGAAKPLVFAEHAHLFASYLHKIVYVTAELSAAPEVARGEQWGNEMRQRDALAEGIARLGLAPEDVVLLSDVDEIPDPATVARLRSGAFPAPGIVSLEQRVHYGGAETAADERWTRAKAMTHAAYMASGLTLSQIRLGESGAVAARGGWHLTYFGDAAFVRGKIAQMAHQEFNTPEVLAGVEARRAAGEDVLGRGAVRLRRVSEAESDYPPPRFAFLKAQFG